MVSLEHLVCDLNGTLALDGKLLDGVARQIASLRDRLEIHLITADTHGGQESITRTLNLPAVRIQAGDECKQKADFVRRLGAAHVAAIGQGANDAMMLEAAAIGICVFSAEGVSKDTLLASDIIVPDIFHAFELFEKPMRLIATLRK